MKRIVLVAALVFAACVSAAPAPKFATVPQQALDALGLDRDKKSVSSGILFVNGHYIKPRYRVNRHGTAVFVNDVQISGQIVPWRDFLATQDGYVPPAPVARPVAAPPPAKKEKTVDDFFDDEPAPAVKPAPAEPAAASKDASEGAVAFVANEKSRKLLKKVEDYRNNVRTHLTDGDVCFFGSRYGRVYVPKRSARALIDALPEAIRDANTAAQLHAMMRARRFMFISIEICEDLMANQADYLQIAKRREQIKDDEKLGL